MTVTATDAAVVRMSCTSGVVRDRKPGDCPCASLLEINLKVKVCRCPKDDVPIDRQPMPSGESPGRECVTVDLVTAATKEIRDKVRVNVPGDRRRVLVLKLTDVNVHCNGGMSHEIQFADGSKHFVSKGDALRFSVKDSAGICSKKDHGKDKDSTGKSESKKKSIRKVLKSQKSEDGKMYSKSVDDVTLGSKKTLTVENDGKVLSKSVQDLSEESHSEFSDMNSIELIIISDEFLNETTKQEVIIVNDRKDIESRRPSKLNVAKEKPKRDKSPKEITRKSTTNQSRRRLVIISDEYKKKSLENKTIVVTKGKYENAPKKKEEKEVAPPKKKPEKSLAEAVGEINSKIISCVLQSYEEPEASVLESKDIKQHNTDQPSSLPTC